MTGHPPIALCDLDGTVANYDGAMLRDLMRTASPGELKTIEEVYRGRHPGWLKERTHMIRSQPGWWRDLPVLEDGMEIFRMLSEELGFTVHVLTKGPVSAKPAWTEKVEWCAKHLPTLPVTIAAEKGLVYGRVLVDDYPGYVDSWLKWRPRGLVVMPDRPWNQGYEHPNCVRWTGENRDEVFARLKHQREREEGKP